LDGTQVGDPFKAARAIELALGAATTPLRLQVGADSAAAVKGHAEQLLKDLTNWEKVAVETQVSADS